MTRIFIIDDDHIMSECVARAVRHVIPSARIELFPDALSATAALSALNDASLPSTSTTPDTMTTPSSNTPASYSDVSAADPALPDLIFLDILLTGPDGFTFLNELISYSDTARIPVVVITSLDLPSHLEHYGVAAVLHKDTMTPPDIMDITSHLLHIHTSALQHTPEPEYA